MNSYQKSANPVRVFQHETLQSAVFNDIHKASGSSGEIGGYPSAENLVSQ